MTTQFDHLTPDEARTEYRRLAREYHPDFGGNLRDMQHLNAEYAEYSANSAKFEARSRQTQAHAAGKKSAADYHDLDELGELLRKKVETLLNISLNSRDFEKVVTVGHLLDVIQSKLGAAPLKKAA